jgi:translation initiation factor IF-3
MKILEGLAEEVAAVAKVEAAPKLDGRNMVMVLAPDRRAKPPARKPTPGTGEDSAAHASAARDGAVGAAAEAVTDGAAPGNVLAPLPPGTSGATSTSGAAVAVAVDGERAPTPSAASAPGAAGEGDTDAGLAAVVSANGSPVPGGVVGASS